MLLRLFVPKGLLVGVTVSTISIGFDIRVTRPSLECRLKSGLVLGCQVGCLDGWSVVPRGRFSMEGSCHGMSRYERVLVTHRKSL